MDLPLPSIQGLQVLTVASAPRASPASSPGWRRGCRAGADRESCSRISTWPSCSARRRSPRSGRRVLPARARRSFACYLTVPLLIPVLTSYPLPLGYMGDILGGGFILAFASFLVAAAAAETGDAYAQLASSRAKTFGAITEPVMLLVVFTVAMITTTDLPYVLGATVRSGPDQIVRPAHLLASAALFMVILYRDRPHPGRNPHRHDGVRDDREPARSFEYSGPDLALLHWGSATKQLVLYVILLNVFVAPWGMASTRSALAVALAIGGHPGQSAAAGLCGRGLGQQFAKLRLFKITEFVSAALLLAALAVFTLYLGGG